MTLDSAVTKMVTFIPKKVLEITVGYRGDYMERETNKTKAIVGAGATILSYFAIGPGLATGTAVGYFALKTYHSVRDHYAR